MAFYRGIDFWNALRLSEGTESCHCLDVLSFISRAAYMYMYAGGEMVLWTDTMILILIN